MIQLIKVVVQDFPKYLKGNLISKVAIIRTKALAKIKYKIKFNFKFLALRCVAHAKYILNCKFHIKFSTKASANAKIIEKGNPYIKFGITTGAKSKLAERGKFNSKPIVIKSYLDPNRYEIGRINRLKHWDDIKLGDMDDLTMQEIAITIME